MGFLTILGGSLAFGVGGAWLSQDAETRRRLHAWLWLPAVMWSLMLLWLLVAGDVGPIDYDWAKRGLNLGVLAVVLAVLVNLARTVTGHTWWYVLPYLVVTGLGAAFTWFFGSLSILDAWT